MILSCEKRAKRCPQLSGVKRSFIRCHSTRKRINMQQLIGNFRTMFLFRGIAAVLFGVLTLVWPKLSLTVLVLVFGVFAVISGITAVVAALRNTGSNGGDCSSSSASWVSWRGGLP